MSKYRSQLFVIRSLYDRTSLGLVSSTWLFRNLASLVSCWSLCFICILLPICVFIWWFMFSISLLLAPKNSRTSWIQVKCILPQRNYTIFSLFRTPRSSEKISLSLMTKWSFALNAKGSSHNLWGRLANCLSLNISRDNLNKLALVTKMGLRRSYKSSILHSTNFLFYLNLFIVDARIRRHRHQWGMLMLMCFTWAEGI